MGIHLAYYKTLSFAVSAALAGLGGALYAHNLRFLSPDQFNIIQSIDLLLMVVIGGLGSIHGVFFGALFLITMPQLISAAKDFLPMAIADAPGLKAAVEWASDELDDDLAGPQMWREGSWAVQYLRSFGATIPGGTSEIQRNIIAERVLGLPRA